MACCLSGAKQLSKPMAGLLSIGPLGTNFSEIWIEIQNFSFMKMQLKMPSGKWQPFCVGGDESSPAPLIIFDQQLNGPDVDCCAVPEKWIRTWYFSEIFIQTQNVLCIWKMAASVWRPQMLTVQCAPWYSSEPFVVWPCGCVVWSHISETHEAETKWLPFCRWCFHMHFIDCKSLYFDSNFTEVCSLESNWQCYNWFR